MTVPLHDFEKNLVREYFKYGSVEKVYKKHYYDIPISEAGYHRLLDKWGVVKAAGPNNSLSEVISFVTKYAEEGSVFGKAYKSMPISFQSSSKSLYRVLSYVKSGVTRRVATALVIHPFKERNKLLIAEDVSTPRKNLGKSLGQFTFPVTFSRKRDSEKVNIKRVLQHEVFTNETIEKLFPEKIIPTNLHPFMYLDIADIRGSVYSIELPKEYSNNYKFSSYKLRNYRFVEKKELKKLHEKKLLRSGVYQIAKVYDYLTKEGDGFVLNPTVELSSVNSSLTG